MKFNKVAFGAAILSEASATDNGACPSSISGVSAFDALAKLVECSDPATSPTTSDAYNALVDRCMAPLVSAAGDLFPAESGVSKVCYGCYHDFALTMLEKGYGTYTTTFTATTEDPALRTNCGSITAPDAREACFKHPIVMDALNAFHTCAGFSLVYPAADDLAHRRVMYRAEAFQTLVRYAFNANTNITGVAAILNGDAAEPATGTDLETEVCYAAMYHFLNDAKSETPSAVITHCGSTTPTDANCWNTTTIEEAKTRFMDCTGFAIDEFYSACSADQLSTLAGTFDGYGALVAMVVGQVDRLDATFVRARDALIATIVESTGADCGACFEELANDIRDNIKTATTAVPLKDNDSLIAQYLASCEDPTADSCLVVIGAKALTNFQECSGVALNRDAFVPTTVAPVTEAPTTEATTEAPVTEAPTTAEPTTTKSAGFVAPLAGAALLAVASLVL